MFKKQLLLCVVMCGVHSVGMIASEKPGSEKGLLSWRDVVRAELTPTKPNAGAFEAITTAGLGAALSQVSRHGTPVVPWTAKAFMLQGVVDGVQAAAPCTFTDRLKHYTSEYGVWGALLYDAWGHVGDWTKFVKTATNPWHAAPALATVVLSMASNSLAKDSEDQDRMRNVLKSFSAGVLVLTMCQLYSTMTR